MPAGYGIPRQLAELGVSIIKSCHRRKRGLSSLQLGFLSKDLTLAVLSVKVSRIFYSLPNIILAVFEVKSVRDVFFFFKQIVR